MIVHDMITISKLLEDMLTKNNDLMQKLEPKLVLVGSAQEGTRIGIGNEIDLSLHFMAWEKCQPFMILGDALHLRKSERCPEWMDPFIDKDDNFTLNTFTYEVCKAVDDALATIFSHRLNPPRLVRAISNDEYSKRKCTKCKSMNDDKKSWFVQCVDCVVAVSRTKMGVCLQFEWYHDDMKKPAYCSIDLVPVYIVEDVETKVVIRLVNSSMIKRSHPPGWYSHLKNYLKEDRLVDDLWSENETINKVLLKCLGNGQYFIRGGQRLRPETFMHNENLRMVYILLKTLRTTLEMENLTNFMIKKMLMDPTFVTMALPDKIIDVFFREVLSHKKFKLYFESRLVVGVVGGIFLRP